MVIILFLSYGIIFALRLEKVESTVMTPLEWLEALDIYLFFVSF